MKLYDLSEKYRTLLDMEEDIDPTVFHDTLDSLEDAIENKAEGYAIVIRQFKTDVKTLKDEEDRLEKRRQAIETKIGIMQESLYEAMKNTGIDKIKSPRFTVWVQKNPVAVSITNETLIPEGYYIPQLPKLDKKQLKEDMKHGEIPGVELVQSEGVRIK